MAFFAVQHGGWCAGSKELPPYKKYGKSNECKDGKGAAWVNNVYQITGVPVQYPSEYDNFMHSYNQKLIEYLI